MVRSRFIVILLCNLVFPLQQAEAQLRKKPERIVSKDAILFLSIPNLGETFSSGKATLVRLFLPRICS